MNESTSLRYHGVHCPAITPFDGAGAGGVDLEAAGTLYDHLLDSGIVGIVILGSIGEFQSIAGEEKRRLLRFAVDHVAGRTAVIAGSGGTENRTRREREAYDGRAAVVRGVGRVNRMSDNGQMHNRDTEL